MREIGAQPTFFSVLLTPGPRPWNDVIHIQGVGLPVQPPWKLPQRYSEVYLLRDCKASQVDGKN